MAENAAATRGWHCAVCGCTDRVPLALRGDGIQIVCCAKCTMGVIEPTPSDLTGLYQGDYYGIGRSEGGTRNRHGYADYAHTAEHGDSWAAALIKLLRPTGGRILDIGCADGHLLAKLGPGYAMFGIEASETTGRIAAERGVVVLGRDVLDSGLIESHRSSFDVIAAIAVFEHLSDIRAGMQTALHLLRDDGVLLFEVPLMSAVHDNAVWLASSLNHVWYPTEAALQHLVQNQLGVQMVGTELHIAGYASTYIGLVFHKEADERAIRGLAARIVLREVDTDTAEEATARMLLHLIHAATPTHAEVGALANLPPAAFNPTLLRRLTELWQADLWRLGLMRADRDEARTQTRALKADLDTMESDRVRTHTELTTSLFVAQARLATAQEDLRVRIATELNMSQQRAALDRDRAAADAAQAAARAFQSNADATLAAAHAMQSGAAWRVAAVLRESARRYPQVARQTRRVARVLWWTVRGRLISKLRLRQQIRVQLHAGRIAQEESPVSRAEAAVWTPPQSIVPILEEISSLDETGHKAPLPTGPKRQEDWPLVSVVVTSLNDGQLVTDAVDSALAQTFKDVEVIVVGGGSSNPSSRFVVAGLRRPRTRVLMQGADHRAAANRNFGISQARGRYICCLDSDDTLAPTYLEKAMFLLERHGYDVVSSAMKQLGGDEGQINVAEQPDLSALLVGNHVLTSAVFRRSLWERSGGFRDVDRNVPGYVYEDWEFWVRLAAMGARFRNLHHDPMLLHRAHPVSLSRGKDVLPMSGPRDMVHQMNRDVPQSVARRISLSRRQASIRSGTPSAMPAAIILDRIRADARPPTLLLTMPFLILGGAERLLSAVVEHLVQAGWRVVITTSVDPGTDHGDTTAWFERHTSEIFHLPRCLPPELWEDFVHHLVRSRGVDVVWVVGSTFVYDCLRGLRVAHPSLRVADLLFNTVGHTANNRRRRDLIDLIFVENDEVSAWLLARGEDATRVRIVESGVDLAALRPRSRSDTLIHQIGATSDDMIVGFAGRWSEEKNPLGFVEIAKLVDPALPVRFVMTGTGHLRPAIEHAIREAGFAKGRFHLLGEVAEIAPILASFDMLVVPSVLDGRPVVVMEALAMGVPVLGSRIGALPELIEDGKTGWLCERDDHRSFATCIENGSANRPGLRDMRRQARDYAETRLNVERMLAAYGTGLASLLPKGRRGG
jgi:glycosyltransferase involved in cell wall biosynthesis/SAM-dependent methyltransferase